MESIEEFNSNLKMMPDLNISTISSCLNLNMQFNLDELSEKINKMDFINNYSIFVNYDKNVKKTISKDIITSSGKIKKNVSEDKKMFYNCLLLNLKKDNEKVSIKIFPNGSVQYTGCKNIETVYSVLNIILKLLSNETKLLSNETNFTRKISLINSNFKLEKRINQESLKNIINTDKRFLIATFDVSRYAGVNAKYIVSTTSTTSDIVSTTSDIVSIFIFSSGSICMTGKNSKNIYSAYETIKEIIYTNNLLIE